MGNDVETIDDKKTIIPKKYRPSEFNILLEKIKVLNKIKSNRKFYNNIDLNIDPLNEFSKIYANFEGINRFSIPIIGALNCGKSTFMNSLLPFTNILETGEKVTSKFICIIRHKKDAVNPEIYNVKLEKRNGNGFNFLEKGDNLYKISDDPYKSLSNIIKQKNNEIKENRNSDDYLINPENYFLIIRMKISLFENELEEYGELIDFLDIPGLNETMNDNNNISGFDDFIKLIFNNILFPIFIFDIQSYLDDGPRQILEEYLQYYSDIIYENYPTEQVLVDGLFILNKIDMKEGKEKDEVFLNFKEYLNKIQIDVIDDSQKLFINVMDDNCLKISAKNLCLEKENSNISFVSNILFNELKNGEYNSFRLFIKNYFKKKFNINIKEIGKFVDESSINDIYKKNLDIINSELQKKCQNYNNVELKLNEFVFLSKKYSEKKKEINGKSAKEIIGKKIKRKIDELLNFKYEYIIEKIDKNLYKQLEIHTEEKPIKDSILFIDNINTLIKKNVFPILNNGDQKCKDIAVTLEEFDNFKNKKKVRICFLGKINSGKTSLLNSIIGNNLYLLECSQKECTKSIFIIKYSKKISFCESKLIKNKYGNYFEDKKEKITDINEIRNTIKSINDKGKINYYSLYVPIEAFENDDLIAKYDIELIDMPGITKNWIEYQTNCLDLKIIMNLCDGFIFSFNKISIEDSDSEMIFMNIINQIKNEDNFNFENCLFVLTHKDDITENLDDKIEDLRKEIKKNFNKKIFSGNFIDRILMGEKIISSQNINIVAFSNLYFEQFQKNIKKIKTLQIINEKVSLENNYEDLEEDYNNVDIIDETLFKNEIKKIKKKIINIYQNSKLNSEYLDKISILLQSVLVNKRKLSKYINSGASNFFELFKKQLILSKKNKDEMLNKKYESHIIKIVFTLLYFHTLCSNNSLFLKNKKEIESKNNNIEKEFQKLITKYNKKFEDKENEIKDIEKRLYKTVGEKNNYLKDKILKIIQNEDINGKIDRIMKKLNKEISRLKISFDKYCLKQILEIYNELESFNRIIDKITLNYKPSSYKKCIGISFGGTISGTLGAIIGYYLDDLAIFASTAGAVAQSSLTFVLSLTGASIPIIIGLAILGKNIYQNKKQNKKKIEDYFEEIFENIKNLKCKYKDLLKLKKDNYLKELNQLKLEENTLKYLKDNKFIEKMKIIITYMNTYN